MFLDEPTTGLDSQSALSVMKLVQDICGRDGKAVVCTIHQPSSEIFELFDSILLLQKGGRVGYFGPVKSMESYFTSFVSQGVSRVVTLSVIMSVVVLLN